MANVLCRNLFVSSRRLWHVKEFSLLTSPIKSVLPNKLALKRNHPKYEYVKFYSLSGEDKDKHENSGVVKENVKLSLFQKFKIMYRDYWYVLLPVHVVTSIGWFGGFYYMAKSGIDIVAILESWNVSEKVVNPLKDSSMGYLAVAYACYKIATPARYTVTLGGTTISINYLKKWGYIKPVPSKERMKEIYLEKKGTLTKSMKETKEGIKEKKDNIIETLHETKEEIKEKKDNLLKSVTKRRGSLKTKNLESRTNSLV
ncbi:protein FAM210A [Leptinotarsa decemlineata]|uniref:protein FAM210A n=1 Tax=Leptinotarsa decemlineata TaxID=7539 RepID=UPI003D30BB83